MRRKKFTKDWGKKLKGKRVGFICSKHGYISGSTCPKCKEDREKSDCPAVHTWTSRWFEHIDVNPIYITSKRQLREECKKRNLKAACLM